ncbi:MAG: SDR family oxidoreductase [Planctomycetota bacterium]
MTSTTTNSSPDPVAVITGASSGIGLATAHRLAREGFRTVLVGRTEEALVRAADTIDGPCTVMPADIGDTATARAVVTRTVTTLGRIDALINNAGAAPLVPIAETTDAHLAETFRVNAIGPGAMIAEAWPAFRQQRQGVVVNVSTLGTEDPFPGFFAYAASKASVNLMTRSCANEGADIGVRAFAVAPGAVETPMLRGLFSAEQIPESACLSPDEVAAVIADCVAGRRDAENGSVIWLRGPTNTST